MNRTTGKIVAGLGLLCGGISAQEESGRPGAGQPIAGTNASSAPNTKVNEAATRFAALDLIEKEKLAAGVFSPKDFREELWQDHQFIIDYLNSPDPDDGVEALKHLNPTTIGKPGVIPAVVNMLARPHSIPPQPVVDVLLSCPEFLDFVSNRPSREYCGVMKKLLDQGSPKCVLSSIPKVAKQVEIRLREIITASPDDRSLAVMAIPSQVKTDPKVKATLEQVLTTEPRNAALTALALANGFSTPEIWSSAARLLDSASPEESKLLRKAMASFVTPEGLRHPRLKSVILEELTRSSESWPRDDRVREKFFKDFVLEKVRADLPRGDFRFVAAIHPELYVPGDPRTVPGLLKLLLEELQRPEVAAKLEKVIRAGDFDLIPIAALRIPRFQMLTRDRCNQDISDHFSSNGFLPSLGPRLIYFAARVPEVLRTPLNVDDFHGVPREHWQTLIFINPSIFHTLVRLDHSKSDDLLEAYTKMTSALRVLGITAFQRFDHAAAIIRNRYPLESPATQKKLRELLPEGYFAGIEDDTRPYALVVVQDPAGDYNNAFQGIDTPRADYIDRLMAAHRVVYVQGRNVFALTETIDNMVKNKVQCDVIFLVGHGSPLTVQIGPTDQDAITVGAPALKYWSGISKPGGVVCVVGCSTGSEWDKQFPSVFKELKTLFPASFIFAPDRDARVPKLVLDTNARIEPRQQPSIQFGSSRTVRYNPESGETTSSPGTSRIRIIAESLNDRYGTLFLFSGLFTVTWSLSLRIRRTVDNIPFAIKEANRQGRQLLLFPSVKDWWLARFVRALRQGPPENSGPGL